MKTNKSQRTFNRTWGLYVPEYTAVITPDDEPEEHHFCTVAECVEFIEQHIQEFYPVGSVQRVGAYVWRFTNNERGKRGRERLYNPAWIKNLVK